ncbi:MAG: methionyl-tRNA formyltransferase [Ruminococcaceae bacterium]|nr:methionyl-tRNA formyltransferase [Oscillospiraceae bacterium]
MGTPDFAVPVLRILAEKYTVVAVVTKIDKPKGRGNKLTPSPVKELALELGIDVLQPENVRTDEFYEDLCGYGANLFVTAAYGKILPVKIIEIPKFGCINVHASLLPYYRGAAPIWRVIMNGEKETGVTTMFTDEGMDTGDILLAEKCAIDEDMTVGELYDKLSEMGSDLIVKTIDGLLDGSVVRTPQDHDKATYAPMVEKEDGNIDWDSDANDIHNVVRGTNPFPTAFTYLDGERIKVWKTCVIKKSGKESADNVCPGTVIGVSKDGIDVSTGSGGIVRILELQGNSSKRMSVRDYLNGHKIDCGKIFKNTI